MSAIFYFKNAQAAQQGYLQIIIIFYNKKRY